MHDPAALWTISHPRLSIALSQRSVAEQTSGKKSTDCHREQICSALIELDMLAFLQLTEFPPNILLHLFFFLLDFVAGIPKRFMLYGLVRRLNHRFHLFK